MIGAMPAVAVRHERRKKKTKDKENRPKHLLLKAHVNKTLGTVYIYIYYDSKT